LKIDHRSLLIQIVISKKKKMDKWLDELDSKLLSIRNQFGQIYYQGFLTGNLDVDRISELSAKRKSLLEQSDIQEKLTSFLVGASSENWSVNELKRKALLLRDLLIEERVEQDFLS